MCKLVQELDLYKHRLSLFQRQRFGSTSEKAAPNQALLEFAKEDAVEDLPEPQAEEQAAQRERKADRKPRGRRPLPPEWPRIDVPHELPESERLCKCCGQPMEKFGEEVTEEHDLVPEQHRVLRHIQYKYACQKCHEGVQTAPPPVRVVEGGVASAGLIATVIEDKFDDHLPLYRQSERFARHGVDLSRATLCAWVGQAAERLRPLWDYMRRSVVKSAVIWTDDTPVKVQAPGTGKTKTARFWIYLGDDHQPHVVFEYTYSRSRDGPEKFLANFKGYLQADAYAGYDRICAGPHVRGVGCWAHARRKFFEAQETDPRAKEMLSLIRELYAVEDLIRPHLEAARAKPEPERAAALEQAYLTRYQLRQTHSQPILDRIKVWLDATKLATLPKSPLGQAITYALNQWAELTRYLEQGWLEIDNNKSENGVRCIALGRKNWLFIGNDASGERAAILYSLIGTCKQHGVDPWAYLKDVLIRISTHPASRIEELLPQNWKRHFAAGAAT
jgi:transposase